MQPTSPIQSIESPRDILAADFQSLRAGLPIRGGWGYTQADACIIDKNDPLVSPNRPFDWVGLEIVFVEKRIYEEMVIFRPPGEQFSGIQWELLKQSLIQDAGRSYDKLVFDITAFPDDDWEELKAEFDGAQGFGHPEFDGDVHERKRQERMVQFTREFWFDITSFHGKTLAKAEAVAGND